jgi:polyhydroxyalkanoate synthase
MHHADRIGPTPERFWALQQEYMQRLQQLLLQPRDLVPVPTDRRFSHAAWREGDYPRLLAAYSLNAEFLRRLAALTPGDSPDHERLRFVVDQWIEAASPANCLATNPLAQQRIRESAGDSLRRGLENLSRDLARGRIAQTDEGAFEIGGDLACSKGWVVFRNDLIEVIEYSPLRERVGTRPILIVPPCINKYYILDLGSDNSFVQHCLSEAMQVYMVSWRNPDASMARLTWDDYLENGVIAAIRAVQEISDQDQINLLGFCVGGTLAATALAVLAAKRIDPAASLTLLTTLLDFSEPGVLGVFIDENQVRHHERRLGKGGLLRGEELAAAFSALRPNDLVWTYVVQNYLLGESPAAFDMLYWNSDSTNLPGPMFVEVLRRMYLNNELCQPNRLECLGAPIDLRRLRIPAYVFAAHQDHIVPWQSAYRSGTQLGGSFRFVLGESGHVAGTINPALKNRRSFRTSTHRSARAAPLKDPQIWLAKSRETPGSWWRDWSDWMRAFTGPLRVPDGRPGSAGHPPLEPAPGRYVRQKCGG